MSGQGPKFVNKQFNSPINLYSPQNVQETLEKQTQILSNGAVGIDFNQLAKPANLQNSAVLRMLEEEEARQRNGQPSLKRVAWPPPPEDQQFDYVEQTPVQAKTRGVGEYASYQGSPVSGSSPQPPTLQAAPQGLVQTSPSPLSPGGTLRQPLHFQQPAAVKGWAPVTPPASSPVPQQHQQQPSWQPQQQQKPAQAPWQQQPAQAPWQQPQQQQQQQTQQYPQQQAYQAAPQQQSYPVAPQQQQSQPVFAPASAPVFEPPPTTITLRPEPPISQEPSPVYQAQPAATRAPIPEFGNSNMRGDQKWPPATVKAQTESENRARMELAKGPAFRPRRVPKDYSGFFAQHALNSTYPGYRTPPGTQYFTPRYQN